MKTRLLLTMLVLVLMSALIASVAAQEEGKSDFVQVEIPPWEQRHQFKLRFDITDGETLVAKPKITAKSGVEAVISIGYQALIGNKDEIEHHLIGHQIASVVEEFAENTEKQDAVARRIEILGEAVKGLPQDLRDRNPEVPWRDIAGARDVLVHEYFRIDLDLAWDMVKGDIPQLADQIRRILEGLDE